MDKITTILVYHRADFDGLCSMAVMWKYFSAHQDKLKLYTYGLDYHDNPEALLDFVKSKDASGEIVIADCTPDTRVLKTLMDLGWNVTLIDHHKTAIDIIKAWDLEGDLSGKWEVGKAACELCWEYFFPDDNMPEAVKLLGRYDVWDHSDPRTLPFQYGMKQYSLSPEGKDFSLWTSLLITDEDMEAMTVEEANEFKSLVDDITHDGETVLDYVRKTAAGFAKYNAFERTIDGLKAICINSSLGNSMALESLFNGNDKYDLMCVFCFTGTSWKVSFYTGNERPNIDVSEIAKKRGGGGHKGAAGCTCDNIDWLLKGE